MLTDDVITENGVCSTILSFSSRDVLYTGTVCKSWRRNRLENSDTTHTSVLEAIRSCSRLQEAFSSGLEKTGVFNIAIVFNADASVLRYMSKDPATYTSDMVDLINYAAFAGNLHAVQALAATFGDFRFGVGELFDAVRGGHIDVIKHIVAGLSRDEINQLPVWRWYWSDSHEETYEFWDKIDFWNKISELATNTSGLEDISNSIAQFFVKGNSFRRSTTKVMSCVDLAIKTNRTDIVRVLCEAGAALTDGVYPMDSTELALATGSTEMVRYLMNEGLRMDHRTLFDAITTNDTEMIQCIIDAGCVMPTKADFSEFFSCQYFGHHQASLTTVEFLLDKGLVGVDGVGLWRDILRPENRCIVDMLLKRGYAVTDATVDDAIEEWDFEFARRLMQTYGRRPTSAAYKFLLLKGYHHEHVDFDHFDFEVCLQKFEWLYSLGCRVSFNTLADMRADEEWASIFTIAAYYTEDVEVFFRDRLPLDVAGVDVAMEIG